MSDECRTVVEDHECQPAFVPSGSLTLIGSTLLPRAAGEEHPAPEVAAAALENIE